MNQFKASSMNSKQMLIIYGCGGHARSVADVALANDIENLLFLDENARINEKIYGYPVTKISPTKLTKHCIVAIGDNKERARIFRDIEAYATSLISKLAYIGREASFADGVFIAHGVHVGPNTQIGANSIVNTHAIVEHDCVLGKHTHISVNATVAGRCHIGDFVMIGAGATVIDGISICSNVIVGSNTTVVSDITEPGTYVGLPARKIK